jgi:hypothetical protein
VIGYNRRCVDIAAELASEERRLTQRAATSVARTRPREPGEAGGTNSSYGGYTRRRRPARRRGGHQYTAEMRYLGVWTTTPRQSVGCG